MPKQSRIQVLIIEPDDDLCRLLTRVLKRDVVLNASIVTSSDHASGLKLLQANPEQYDIVITYAGHSEPRFLEFVRNARTASPGTSIVLFTGGCGDVTEAHLDAIVAKPYTRQLVESIAAVAAARH